MVKFGLADAKTVLIGNFRGYEVASRPQHAFCQVLFMKKTGSSRLTNSNSLVLGLALHQA
jgi:hypothetical protein